MRALPILLIVLAAALTGCGKPRISMPPKGDDLTYLRVVAPVHPHPGAAVVKLALDNTEFDRRSGRVIEHPATIRVLTSAERATFESALHGVRVVGFPPPELSSPACFVPHHFFRYSTPFRCEHCDPDGSRSESGACLPPDVGDPLPILP